MLTSFFRKSGPLNFMVVSAYVIMYALLWFFLEPKSDFTTYEIGKTVVAVLLLIFSLFLLDFIIRKNGLTQINGYSILLFASLVCFFPQIFSNVKLVASNVCLLFALRRMFSLQSLKNNERKILDASLWIAAASLLFPPSLLMVLGLVWAIFVMPMNKLRYFFIPVVGILAVFILMVAYSLLRYDNVQWLLDLYAKPSWDFARYGTKATLIGIAFVAGTFVWAFFLRIAAFSRVPKKERPNYLLVGIVWLVSLGIILFSNPKDTSELLVAFGPMAIICSNYIETDTDKWFKECILWLFVLLPFAHFIVG